MTRNRPCNPNDGELVLRAQCGERCAFDELAARHRSRLLAIAFMRTGFRDDAEDLVQDALTAAWNKLASLQEPHAFGAWLRRIMSNACHNWRRSSHRWTTSIDDLADENLAADGVVQPIDVIVARERQREWRRALLALPENNRIAFLMHVWGDSSYEEIATALNLPLTTVEGRIHRAKTQLRRSLRKDFAELIGIDSTEAF